MTKRGGKEKNETGGNSSNVCSSHVSAQSISEMNSGKPQMVRTFILDYSFSLLPHLSPSSRPSRECGEGWMMCYGGTDPHRVDYYHQWRYI